MKSGDLRQEPYTGMQQNDHSILLHISFFTLEHFMKLKPQALTFATLLMSAVALPAVADPAHNDDQAAPSSSATHEIRIDPQTKYVNVTGGDIVQFDVGNKTFTRDIDASQNTESFDLNEVAPNGLLDHPVTVYVTTDSPWLYG